MTNLADSAYMRLALICMTLVSLWDPLSNISGEGVACQ